MAKKVAFGWQNASVATLKLQLDALKPRVDVSSSASQEQIRTALIEGESVVELAVGSDRGRPKSIAMLRSISQAT